MRKASKPAAVAPPVPAPVYVFRPGDRVVYRWQSAGGKGTRPEWSEMPGTIQRVDTGLAVIRFDNGTVCPHLRLAFCRPESAGPAIAPQTRKPQAEAAGLFGQ